MNVRGVLAGLGTSVILSGCTMIPKYQRPPAPASGIYPVTTPSALAAAERSWRTVFADPRLRELIALALAHNQDLKVAILNVEQSRAQYRISLSALVPNVDATGGYTRAYSAGRTTETWTANVATTAYELDLFGRIRSLNAQALETFFASQEAQRAAQLTLVAEVATQYYTLRHAEAQMELARQVLASVEESYTLNKASFDAGATNELDVRTAEGQVETAKINVLAYERQAAQARDALELLLGTPAPPDLPAGIAFATPGVIAEMPPGLPADLIARRPDILEAEHTLKAANANIGAARAAFFPTVSLTSSIGTTSGQLKSLFGPGTGIWNVSPQITLPIFNGGENLANLDVAKVSTRIEIVNYQKAIQTAFREVADAVIAAESYAREIELERALIATQRRRFELANLRYRHGETTYLDVLSAQQDLYNAQQSELTARLNQLSGQISLYQALGGGWQ